MSAYERWEGSGPDGELVAVVDNWRTFRAEQVRRNLLAFAAQLGRPMDLGGSRLADAPATSGEVVVPDWWDVDIDWRVVEGLIVQARVEVITRDAGTSVTPRIKNLTDVEDIDGVASVDTDWAEQLITIPPPAVAAVKRYRFYLVGSNAGADIGGIGKIEVFDDMEPST